MTDQEKIVEVASTGIAKAMGSLVSLGSTPQSTYYARAALSALEKEGYVVRKVPGITHEQEPYTSDTAITGRNIEALFPDDPEDPASPEIV